MIYLLLSVVLSAMIGIMMRLSQKKIKAKITVLAFNYITCIVAASFFLGEGGMFPHTEGSRFALWMGIVNGFLYVASLMLSQHNIRVNGVVLSSLFSKIGDLLIPFTISVLVFDERPGTTQLIGALLAVTAILAMNSEGRRQNASSAFWLMILFFTDGIVGSLAKVFQELGNNGLAPQFLFYTFFVALLCCLVVIVKNKERPGWWEVLFGILVGVPNYFSSYFLIKALNTVPAVVVYPSRSVGAILVTTLAGVVIFHEKLHKRQWLVFPVMLAAVALLSI